MGLFLFIISVALTVLFMAITFVFGWKDTYIFLKTRRWPDYPNWVYLGGYRIVVEKEAGDYYQLKEQGLYIDMNDKEGRQEWRDSWQESIFKLVESRIVMKDSVVVDKEGVVHDKERCKPVYV